MAKKGLIYTAQYRYNGPDRIDITYKTEDPYFGAIFKPTKELVFAYKDGRIDETEYASLYRLLMRESYKNYEDRWLSLLTRPSITFVCFCASGDFCHRLLLADYFTKIGAVYMGERKQVSKLVWE